MMYSTKMKSLLFFLGILSMIFTLTSCGDDEMTEADPCDNIEFNGNTMSFNGQNYRISEYSYSDLIVFNHNFRFKAFDDDCMDSLEVTLDFSHSVSFPQFSLAGDYTTKFVTNVLELELEEMGGSFQLSGGSRQTILSGGTATISEPDGNSYLITVDTPTGALGSSGSMELSVTVPK